MGKTYYTENKDLITPYYRVGWSNFNSGGGGVGVGGCFVSNISIKILYIFLKYSYQNIVVKIFQKCIFQFCSVIFLLHSIEIVTAKKIYAFQK